MTPQEQSAETARELAQIAADFIWAENFAAAREHLELARKALDQADPATANDKTIEV